MGSESHLTRATTEVPDSTIELRNIQRGTHDVIEGVYRFIALFVEAGGRNNCVGPTISLLRRQNHLNDNLSDFD